MTPTLFLLRIADALSLSLASTSIALALSDERGVAAYSQFVAVSVLGGALGGLLAFVTVNLLRRRAPAPLSAILSGAARIVLALAFAGWFPPALPLLYAAGFVLMLSSVMLVSMFHSLTSTSPTGLRARTGLLAATATGGLFGAPLAGTIVEAERAGQLLGFQAVGISAGLIVAFRFHRAFAGRPLSPRARTTPWRLLRPIAWRVPVIAGLSFSLGSLAPGALTDLWGPRVGGFVAATYLTGAVTGAAVLRAAPHGRLLHQTFDALRGHRAWFLPTSLGTLVWLFMLGPIWASLLATLVAGVVLHLVQAGFEQAAADLGEAEESGPNVVLIHSLAGLATALGLTVLPRAIDGLGLATTIVGLAVALGVLAVHDSRRPSANVSGTPR